MGLRGDWQLVTLTRLFLSSKNKKKKDVNEPLMGLIFGSVRLLVFGCFHPIQTLFGPVQLLKSSDYRFHSVKNSMVRTLSIRSQCPKLTARPLD